MDLLRAAPGAEIVLAAVAGEPGVYVVGGAVRDALLGLVAREL
jgi:tRNA nucleotidyltransferase (CCA-adding enzyme)